MNVNLVKNFILTFLLILTRFYAQNIYLNYLPQTVNVYFIYACAFCGFLYTKHLESRLVINASNYYHNNMTTASIMLSNNKIKYSNCNGNSIFLSSKNTEKDDDEENLKSKSKINNIVINNSSNVSNSLFNAQGVSANKCNLKMNNINLKSRRKLSVQSLPSMMPKRRISLPIISVKSDKVSLNFNLLSYFKNH